MACGDKYKGLLVTEDGHTPEDPCYLDSPFCFIGEYDRWKIVADKIAAEVKRRLGLLGGKEAPTKLPGPLNERIAEYRKAYHELSFSGWVNLVQPDFITIEEAVANGREGTCVMELLDEKLTENNIEIPGTTLADARPATPGIGTRILVGGGAVIAVVGLGAVAWWAITKPREDEAA